MTLTWDAVPGLLELLAEFQFIAEIATNCHLLVWW